MDDPWQYQLRITVSAELAASLRGDPSSGTYVPLGEDPVKTPEIAERVRALLRT